ncbi:MAG: hypothetical protein WEB37_08730 [Bacteroidota bacterium]
MMGEGDLRVFSHENILRQIQSADYQNGYFTLEFYALDNGKPSKEPTGRVARFYLYPSGGTLRDENFQLIVYDSRFDTYRGFKLPENRE